MGELDKAFIHEHSEINLQGPTLLEEVEIEQNALNRTYTNLAHIGPFSITAMLEKNGTSLGRKTQN